MMVSSGDGSVEGDIRLMMVSPTPRSLPQLGQKLSVDDIGLSQCGQFMKEAPFIALCSVLLMGNATFLNQSHCWLESNPRTVFRARPLRKSRNQKKCTKMISL